MRRILIPFMILIVLASVAGTALAATGTGFTIQDPIGARDLETLIKTVTDAIRNLAIPVGVVMILWAGFNYLTSAGSPIKIKRANSILLYTSIGLAVIFIGGGFVDLIRSVLGANDAPQTLPVQNRPDLNQLAP